MKLKFKYFLFAGIIIFILLADACKLYRFAVYNFSDITDYTIFPERAVAKSAHPYHFSNAGNGKVPRDVALTNGKQMSFDSFIREKKSVAFLIIQNDSIVYEKYMNGYDESSIVASFSMAKSVTSLLIGAAINDGLIGSEDEPVIRYIPELKNNGFEHVTIKHLLQMTSGLNFNESYYNPFGHAATFYYGTNLRKAIKHLHLKAEPGTRFEYTSGSTQLLGLVLERALKDKTITQYLQEKIWTPLEMEYDASWSVDRKKNALEKTFCCINARAKDFAKIGRLMLHKGSWNGKQIIPEKWIEKSTMIDTTDGAAAHYQYQWWLAGTTGDFYARGHLGQYIYVSPSRQLIIVRLGSATGEVDWPQFLSRLASEF